MKSKFKKCMRIMMFGLFVLCLLSIDIVLSNSDKLKVLHLSFHTGCLNDFEEVAKRLPFIELTSWNISADVKKLDKFTTGLAIYNMSAERAHRAWVQNADYFNSFDLIITSDTAPLSRIFLQNNWTKPLIVWVCNRFDYYDGSSLDCHFPDPEYYDLIRKASTQKNVKIVSYTPYEIFYARLKNVDWGDLLIKPIGSQEMELQNSSIPTTVNKSDTVFVIPRLESWGQGQGRQLHYIMQECSRRGISLYSGSYNGPDDLTDFKAVICFPYALSNLALFENICRGVIHFVPTIRFVQELKNRNLPVCYNAEVLAYSDLCEWYHMDNKDWFVYFDSWDDLAKKISTTNFKSMKAKVRACGKLHQTTTLMQWESLLNEFRK